jgi:hypothetical protein
MKAVARLYDLGEDAGWSQTKQRLFEFRHCVAAADLAKIAAVLAGWAIRQFAGHSIEAFRRPEQIGKRTLRPGAEFGDGNSRRYLKQNVTGMDQVAALEVLAMCLVVAPAFFFRRHRDPDLLGKKALDGPTDLGIIGNIRREKLPRNGALPQQLPHGSDLLARPRLGINCNAVNADRHDRTGTFARVRGVRTI